MRYRVQQRWQRQFGEDYFGSRDIDVAYLVDATWGREDLAHSAVGLAPERLERMHFQRSGMFRFSLMLGEDGRRIETVPGQAIEGVDFHILNVDLMVTSAHPVAKEVLGFLPIDEPLLAGVFGDGGADRLAGFHDQVLLPSTPLLIATKLRSLPERTKDDKRTKDLCDLYALAAYGGASSSAIRKGIHSVLDDAAALVNRALENGGLSTAVRHLDISPDDYRAVVGPLALTP